MSGGPLPPLDHALFTVGSHDPGSAPRDAVRALHQTSLTGTHPSGPSGAGRPLTRPLASFFRTLNSGLSVLYRSSRREPGGGAAGGRGRGVGGAAGRPPLFHRYRPSLAAVAPWAGRNSTCLSWAGSNINGKLNRAQGRVSRALRGPNSTCTNSVSGRGAALRKRACGRSRAPALPCGLRGPRGALSLGTEPPDPGGGRSQTPDGQRGSPHGAPCTLSSGWSVLARGNIKVLFLLFPLKPLSVLPASCSLKSCFLPRW